MNTNKSKLDPKVNPFDTDLKIHRRFGLLIFIMLFGFGGLWSATAPIDGAAVASGILPSRSKTVLSFRVFSKIDSIFEKKLKNPKCHFWAS